jgi:Flp pilus assembly pilin Flp
MRAWVVHTARALADRKGVTSIEYAMIAAGAMTIVVACYNAYFNRMVSMLATIGFS